MVNPGSLALYKRKINAPTTVNKVKSEQVQLDKELGRGFRIEKAWLSIPSADTIVAGDKIGFQITTEDRSEEADLLDINDEQEVFTYMETHTDYGTAGVAIKETIRDGFEIPGIAGTMLDLSMSNYWNVLITGQDGAIESYIKVLGNFVDKGFDKFHYNTI